MSAHPILKKETGLTLHYYCLLSDGYAYVFIKFLINVTNYTTSSKIIASFNTQDFSFFSLVVNTTVSLSQELLILKGQL